MDHGHVFFFFFFALLSKNMYKCDRSCAFPSLKFWKRHKDNMYARFPADTRLQEMTIPRRKATAHFTTHRLQIVVWPTPSSAEVKAHMCVCSSRKICNGTLMYPFFACNYKNLNRNAKISNCPMSCLGLVPKQQYKMCVTFPRRQTSNLIFGAWAKSQQ